MAGLMLDTNIQMSARAADKVSELIQGEENDELKLRVFVTGGGCSGFSYGFTFDDDIAQERSNYGCWPDELPISGGSRGRLQGRLAGIPICRYEPQCFLYMRMRQLICNLNFSPRRV